MMNKKRTSWKGLGKYTLYLPLFAALLLTAYAWGQQHEIEAKAFVEKVTADSKMVEAITTTFDNALALAQSATYGANPNDPNNPNNPNGNQTQPGSDQANGNLNAISLFRPGVTFSKYGDVYRVIDDNSIEVAYSRSSTVWSFTTNAIEKYTGRINADIEMGGKTYEVKSIGPDNRSFEIDGKTFSITSIGQNAFADNDELRSIEIPSTVTVIDNQAYMNCITLSSVKLPPSLKRIGSEAFKGCRSLTEITIPSTVSFIGEKAFHDCTGLKRFTVDPNNMQYSSVDGVIFDKLKTTLISFPYNRTSAYTIPSFVKTIGMRAFLDCSGLTSVTIPSSVTTIMPGAFKGCTGLSNITLSSSVTEIETEAFKGCTGLTSVTLPASLTKIGADVFKGCTGLTSIVIPASVKTIDRGAFAGCTALTSVTIPATTRNIVDGAFDGCNALKQLIVDPKNPVFSSYEGSLVRKFNDGNSLNMAFTQKGFNYQITSSNTVALVPGGVYQGDIVIPSTVEHDGKTYQVTSIGEFAFSSCTKLKSVSLPATISSIENALKGASEWIHVTIDEKNPYFTVIDDVVFNKYKTTLIACKGGKTHYVIPSTVTRIEKWAFQGDEGLKSVVIPSSVKSIGESAFYTCASLTALEIPASVTSIETAAFLGCFSLKSVVLPASITTIKQATFTSCNNLTSITIPASVTSIGNGAFGGCSSLTSITIPSSVNVIEQGAFSGCTSLTSITLPSSLSMIVQSTFAQCSSLTSITLPASVKTIESGAFSQCSNLKKVTLGAGMSSLLDAFIDCNALKIIEVDEKNPYLSSVDGVVFNKDKTTLVQYPPGKAQYVIPSTVKSIANNAFRYCSGLTTVTIPASVTNIGKFAFQGCSGLTSIVLPPSLKSIEGYAFYGCINIRKVNIPASVVTIEGHAFSLCPIDAYRVDGNNPSFTSVDGVLFNKDKTTLIACPLTKSGSYTIPSTVTRIGETAFLLCAGLTSVVIPESVKTIGSESFYGCKGLNSTAN